MATIDGLLLCCCFFLIWFLCTCLIKTIKNNLNSGNRKPRHPPSPPAIPIIGHLHLLGSNLAKSLDKLAHSYGPFVQLRLGASTCYVVSDSTFAKEILKTNELNFVSRPEFDTSNYYIYKGSGFLTAPYDTYWRFMKKICMTRLLSTSQLNKLAHIREQEVMKLVESLINVSREGEACDLKKVLTALTNNIVCRMGMSTRCSENANEAREIKDLADEVSELGGKLTVGNILGPLAKLDLFGHGRQLQNALEKFDRMMERIIKEHEKKEDMKGINVEAQRSDDLMDILLEISRDANAEMKLTTKEIKAFFLDIIMAGTHTSSLGVVWALAEVINNPKTFKKLREEINSVVGSNRLVQESDVPNLPYLQAVVKESLRLHPPGPALLRECIEDCNINGFDLKGKTRMLINVYTIMRDPRKWTDPDEFIPERFMGNSLALQNQMQMKGQDFGYLPFGSGRRGCTGASLALMVTYATIGSLVQCFDWKVKGGEKVDLQEGPGFSPAMAHPFFCYPITHFNPFELDLDHQNMQ